MLLRASRPTAARVVGLVVALPLGVLLGWSLLAAGTPLPLASAAVIEVTLAGWLLGEHAVRGRSQHFVRVGLAADIAAAGAGVFSVFVAAGLADGLLDGLATGAFVDWGLLAWVLAGLPLLIVGLPFSVAWVAVVRLVLRIRSGSIPVSAEARDNS